MKIILVDTYFHNKNKNAFVSYKNIQTTRITDISQLNNINLAEYDAVYSPSEPIIISCICSYGILFHMTRYILDCRY